VPTATVTVSGVTLADISAAAVTAAASLCPQHFGAGLLFVMPAKSTRTYCIDQRTVLH
jgi:hypothetical protein